MTEASHEPPPTTLGAILATILSVRDWQRAFILIVLGLAVLVGALVWEAHDRLANALEAFLAKPPTLALADRATLEATAQRLVSPFRPDYGAVVWAVNMEMNRRTLLVFVPGDVPLPAEFREMVPGVVVPILTRQRNANLIAIALLDGETVCGEPATYQGRIPFGCFAGIPPGPGVLLGLIGVLFPQPLSDHDQALTRSALQAAAETLTVYR